MTYHLTALLLLILAVASAQAEPAEQKVALVIGNAAYKTAPLDNPVNDARAMAQELAALGFAVVSRENLRVTQIPDALREFRNRLRPGAVALFFYAGHGLQIKGVNYLPAVDAKVEGEDDVPLQSINVNQVLDLMEDSKTRLNLVFLDACRNNPYARSFRSAAGGLARISAPSGTLISFATRPGQVAFDGDGEHGVYTENLLREMVRPNQPVEQVLKGVVSGVKKASQGKQEPWMEGSLEGDFYFVGGAGRGEPVKLAAAGIGEAAAYELTFWESVKGSQKPADYRAYLAKYPQGQFAALAEARLVELTPPTAAAASARETKAEPRASTSAAPPQSPPGAPGSILRDCPQCPELVVLPAGTFFMGTSRNELGSGENERPRHEVSMAKPLAIGRFEVTRGQYAVFVKESGYRTEGNCHVWRHPSIWEPQRGNDWQDPDFGQGDDHPVVCVTWHDAQAYLAWLGRKTGKAYRLPSEAEWEYLARAGTKTSRYWGDDPSLACEYGNVHDQDAQRARRFGWEPHECRDGFVETAPVGRFKPNAFGLYDVLGNVWEWTAECLSTNYINAPGDGSARVSDDCAKRVYRGGGWSGPALPRSGVRNGNAPGYRSQLLGFRVLRPL